jgi:hypothetical protein
MDKNIIKETMLSLERAALQSAREKYFDYVADARLDRSEPIENDEQAQAEIASDLSEALDDTLHDHTDKLDKLREVDFGQSRLLLKERLCGFLVDTSSLPSPPASSHAMVERSWGFPQWPRFSGRSKEHGPARPWSSTGGSL